MTNCTGVFTCPWGSNETLSSYRMRFIAFAELSNTLTMGYMNQCMIQQHPSLPCTKRQLKQLTLGIMGGIIVLFWRPSQSKPSNHLQRVYTEWLNNHTIVTICVQFASVCYGRWNRNGGIYCWVCVHLHVQQKDLQDCLGEWTLFRNQLMFKEVYPLEVNGIPSYRLHRDT